ncbi:unnamed protein product, partial [marine sediment metagenome]
MGDDGGEREGGFKQHRYPIGPLGPIWEGFRAFFSKSSFSFEIL